MSSYYGRPILKQPVWRPEVAWYFFAGGLAGASAGLAFVARLAGNPRLARSALVSAAVGTLASPPLLIKDLGRPERFHHMLRVFKPTSPMSLGTWILSAFGASIGTAAASEATGLLRPVGRVAEGTAAVLGPALSTYTAVLVSDTAIPVWHQARHELPFIFAGSAAASAGAAATMLTRPRSARPARRLAVGGALLELVADQFMRRNLGTLANPYRRGEAKVFDQLGKTLTIAGAAGLGLLGRKRPVAIASGALVLAGGICERFAIFRAGFQSARETTGEPLPAAAERDRLQEQPSKLAPVPRIPPEGEAARRTRRKQDQAGWFQGAP